MRVYVFAHPSQVKPKRGPNGVQQNEHINGIKNMFKKWWATIK